MSDPKAAETPFTTQPVPPAQARASAVRGRPRRRRKWVYRLAAMTVVPTLFFGLLEIGLRIGGYGRDTRFFMDGTRLERPGVAIDNQDFGKWIFPGYLDRLPGPVPFILKSEKKSGTYRVFVLGESAAMGYPEPSVSFGRILEVLLKERYPNNRFEVVNTAMTAINSHVVLPIARECAEHEPDLFVVHLGNNEVVGPYGAAGVLGSHAPSRRAIRTNLAIRRTRTGQLFASLTRQLNTREEAPREWAGMTMFVNNHVRVDDARLTRTYEQFRDNLHDVCEVAHSAITPLVVCTIPVNLKDSAPFGSLHAPGLSAEQTAAWEAIYAEGVRLEGEKKYSEAIARYSEAAGIDDGFAELDFRWARSLAALGKHVEARDRFIRAKDLDTLRFRSDTTINRTIRAAAAGFAGKGVLLADVERAFEQASPTGAPGEELFLEHVHMNFAGNYLMALTVFQTITPMLDERFPNRRPVVFSEQQCRERLAYTNWNEHKIVSQIRSTLLDHPPFTGQLDKGERNDRWEARVQGLKEKLNNLRDAVLVHASAVEAAEGDWMIRMNFALLLTEVGELEMAKEQYKKVLENFRHCLLAHVKLGNIMLRTGQLELAEKHFKEALRLSPDLSEARLGTADVRGAQGRVDEGAAIYESELQKTGDRGSMLVRIGSYFMKTGSVERARAPLEEAIRLKPDNAMGHALLGDVADKLGRQEEAISHYEAALRIRPDWPELSKHLAELKRQSPPGR